MAIQPAGGSVRDGPTAQFRGSALPRTDTVQFIGVARGCTGCTCTPRVEKKLCGPNLQGKVVSAPPSLSKSPFFRKLGKIWTVGVVNLVDSCSLCFEGDD